MDLRTFLRNNANLKSRPRRRRHSIADVRFLHTFQDIPEKPEEEHVADERRHSTGSFAKTEKPRSSSEPPNPPCCNESGIRPATIVNETETNSSETARSKRSLSREESEDLIEAVSTYVLSYTDDQENLCSVNNLSPTSTGSSSPQESSKETSDEELALSDILREVDTPMVSQRLRRGSMKDLELMERITSLTPITESSRSSSRASRSSSQNGLEIFPDINDGNEGTNHGLHCPTPKTAGKKEEMLGKILVSPHITRRGSLSDLLKLLSPNFDTRKENGLQGMGKDEELRPEYISLNAETQMKDQSRSLFPVNSGKYSPKVSVNEKHSSVKITDALGKANNSPVSLKRRTSGDLLNSLSSIADRVSFKASDTKKSLGSEAIKEKHEVSSVNKEKDDLFGRIMKSPCLTRRGSIGDVLNALTPNPVRRCPSPSPLTIKCDTHDELVLKTQPVSPEMPKLKDAERATCEPGVGKCLLAIVQQHVMNHSQAMQRRRSNSIASTEPHTGTMETVLKKWNEDRNRAANNESFVGKTSDKDSSQKGDIVINTTSSSMTATKNSMIKENNGSGTLTSTNTSKHIHDNNNNKINKSANTNQCNSANNTEVLNPQTHNPQENISEENKANVDHETTSSVSRQLVLVGSPSKHVPQGNSEQDVPSAKTTNRKISAPLPPRSDNAYHVPKRKSSVNVMKRSPVTVVISKDKAGKTEVHRKVSQFQIPSGVNLTDSRFLPLSKEEAEDYNRIKNAEESALPRKNSTVTMSSKVTIHGGSGAVVRKVGVASKRPVLDASLPTEERFAALSERYANLKAKIGGNDDKKKSTESSPNLIEKNDSGPSTEDTLTQSKCWTTVESIPVQVYVDQVFENPRDFTEAETKETLSGKNKSPESRPKPDEESDSGPYTEDTLIQSKCWTTVENITVQEYVDRVSDKPRDLTEAEKQVTLTGNDEDKQTKNGEKHDIYKSHMATNSNNFDNVISCINDSEKKASIDLNNNSKPSIPETQVEEDSCWIDSKTPLDLRPETPTQKTRTSVVAKLMNRKMKPRRKQSIVPCVVQRRSRVYTKECSGHEGIPASVAEFEKIRNFVENTVLRAPVRQEASNILDLLTGLSTCLTEIELVAICKECSKTLRTLDALGSLPTYLSLETVIINPSGTIKFKHLSTGISIDDLYLAPEHSNNFASEKTCIFSLAATLWSAADWRLTEAEKPFLSSKFQELLVSMTDDAPDARPCLYDVLKTCESLQIENDMTSRERCQALLWEYQASATMDSDDTTRRKTVEGEKKHHDTLMGSISVAASFKGFLKQTTKPQERNPFVKTQNNGESFRNLDGGNSGDKRNETIPKPEEMKAEKTKVIVNSPMSEATSSNSLNSEKDRLASDSLNERSSDTGDDISDQDRTRDRKRGHSLTEDEKQQLLSLLASTKLNKGPFYTGENDKKSDEIIKSVEDQSTKPPSPSLFAYPHYGQTESQMMFNPIIPAGRSTSPSVHSDVSENQIPSVPTPTFVPIAVPIPSVAPVPMPPYWYVPQGGMMSFPHPAMSPVPFHPVDSSVTSNQSAVSTDSDFSNLSDVDPRPKNKNCATPKSDKSEGLKADTQKNNKGCKQNKQDNKASKLPRPIWQRPVPKSRTTSEELESNAKVVRRRVPFNDEFNEGSEGTKPVRTRTPSPSLGRRAAPQEVNPPRSQTPPVYWTRDGVDMSPRNKPRARASTGSFPNRPPSPSSLLDGRRRSSSATLGSITNSPVQGRKNQGSRPSSPVGSRSNSPVSMLVSKFEQMSQESADSSPRVRSNSVTSMISRFGSSSLVPEDRLAKGQFKPHNSTTPKQPASKTGPFRPSSVRSKVHSTSDIETSILRSDNSILSQEMGKGSDASKDESSTHHTGNPREVQRSGSDPGSTDSRERRVSSSHCMLQEEKESTSEKCHDSRTRLLENIRKWTSQENILRDCSSSEALEDNAQERLASGLFLFSDYCTKRDQGDQKGNPKARLQGSFSGKSKSSTYSGRSSSSNDLRNDYIIKSGNVTHNLSKPWQDKESSLNRISIKSSLDSEPVREKSSPRLRPRDLCLSPERDSSIPFCDVRSPNDLLWSPRSDTHQFEIPVDLAILDATTPIVSSPPASVGGLDWTYGGVDGNVISPPFPLSPGSLKDFKPSNYFTSVTFKCGEMEPERDTNCILNRPSRDTTEYVSSDCVSNRRDPTGNYVRRFERKILRSTGDLETEVFASNSTPVQKSCYPTENSSFKKEINDNPRPIPNSPLPSKSESSSIIAHVNGNPKTPRTRSRIDQVVRSRHPSGDCPPGKDIAAVSKNPSSPMTLKKIMSNPLSQDASTPQRRISTSKRNSLPTSQPVNLSPGRDRSSPVENRTITKSSSHTYLSQKHQKVFKSSPQNNPSVRQSSGDLSKSSPKEGNLGKSSPYSKPMPSNNPSPNVEESKSRGSSTTAKPGNPSPSKERHGAKGHSSNPHAKASRTVNSTATSADPSESNPVRYPYTRRGSLPAGGSSTIKPSPKTTSNPTSPLHAKPPKAQIEFFGAAGADNPRVGINPRDSNRRHENLKDTHQNPGPRSQGDFESSVDSSKAPSQCAKSSSISGFSSHELASEQSSSSMGKIEESEVFYIPRSDETLLKSDTPSSKGSKRFPSNSSSDSGLNLSDPDESRGSIGKGKKNYRARSPPSSPTTLSPSHSPSPTSPKFTIGHSIFYDPKDHKPPLPSSEEGPLSVSQNDPTTLAFLSNSIQQENVSNPFKASVGKSEESPNKPTRSDNDNFKHLKSDMSKIMDGSSPNSDEKTNVHLEKPKEGSAAAKLATDGRMMKSTEKEFELASTPPPDILGRPASKSPPSSSRVDSKELLGQLVKKVLNSAAAKQGSSPNTSFAESAAKESGKGKRFTLTNETTEAKQKEKIGSQGKNPTLNSSKHKSGLSDTEKASKIKETELMNSSETSSIRNPDEITPTGTLRSHLGTFSETPISPNNASMLESSSRKEQSLPGAKGVLSTIIDMIHDEFAFDGYLDDGVEDVNMAEYVLSLAGMSEENFKEAITDQYSDLYWDEDLLHEMYEAVTEGQQTRRPTLQFSESTVSDISPPESISLSREESYLSLEPLYFNSISRSSSERSGTGARDILISPMGEATEFLPIKVIAPEMQADIQELLTPIFEDYHRVMGVKLISSVEGLTEKLGTKIVEISQQLMLERRAKKKSMNSYNKMAEVENKKDVKDLASKLVNEIEGSDKKIIYLKNVQRQLRNVYAERFGLDTSLLYSFLVSYNTSCVTLVSELNNSFLNFSPIWNQRGSESIEILDESLSGPSLQSGTKLGLFSYLFDRHAMSQAYVRYFLYTFRYIATAQELFNFIREKCSASLRTDSSGQVYNHQLQIRYRGLDLLSEWIDSFYQFDFKTNPNLIKELLAFVKDELILVDRSERGHYLMELISEKQKRDLNNNLSSDEPSDFVAVLQLEEPQGLSPVDVLRKPLGSRKAKSPVQCFRRAPPEKDTTYKATLYLKALSILDHSSRILAEQLTLIQQDLFFHIHPVHFLNSRAHGIGVGRNQSPTKERDNMFGFSTGSRRASEMSSLGEGLVSREQNMYVSEPSTDGLLEDLLEHAHDVSLWVAVEICSASSIKAQLALITKFVNAARYCCEIRNYSTCIQIVDALEMFVIRQLPVWRQVPTKTTETLEELKAVKVLLKTDSSWLMKSEASREKPTIPCFLLFVIHVQQQELGGFTLPNDMYKWTKMRSTARLVDQIRLFKQMRYAFQTNDEVKERLKQRIQECKSENLHALASENASNFHLSSSQGSRKFHDAFRKMKATFGGHN